MVLWIIGITALLTLLSVILWKAKRGGFEADGGPSSG